MAVARKIKPAARKPAPLEKNLSDALAQQAATAEILGALARSSGDAQPVFDAIVENAHRLCGAVFSILYRYDGKTISVVADRQVSRKASRALRSAYPAAPRRGHLIGRAILERRTQHSADVPRDARFPDNRNAFSRLVRYRAALVMPLLRGKSVVGAIATGRMESKAFSKTEIRLLKTFADQAVIAIENVRLFNETKEALEHQRATADVLASIGGSMTDTKPVFDAVVRNLQRLFGTRFAVVQLVRNGMIELPAVDSHPRSEKLRESYPRPLDETTGGGRAMLSKKLVQYAPVLGNPAAPPATEQFARDLGFNSVIFTPMIHEGRVIGAIGTAQRGARPFDERQIALLKTFADQAVIAIENVRLFNETQEALEQQTATTEILKVISSSPTDVQPVFEAIASSALRLFGGLYVCVSLVRGDRIELASTAGQPEAVAKLRSAFPRPLDRETVIGRAIVDRAVQNKPDMRAPELPGFARALARRIGVRAQLSAPMLREGVAIGAITLFTGSPVEFSAKQVTLLKTFADQAVIAIENVRLFNETREALERQTATAEILRVISRSVEDTSPVFDAIVEACVRIFPEHIIGINMMGDDGRLILQACHSAHREALKEYFRCGPERKEGSSFLLKRRVAQFPDVQSDPDVPEDVREGCKITGARAIIYAPMVSANRSIGTIWVGRERPGPFSDKEVALLQTFADQAVIAIQNARLFNETKEALERQTATADILRVISSSPTDTQPVFDAILQKATALCDANTGALLRYDGEAYHALALRIPDPAWAAAMATPRRYPPGSKSGLARLVREKRPVHIPDLRDDDAYRDREPARVEAVEIGGMRSWVGVPMLKDGDLVGAIMVYRKEVRPFDERQIALLQTFADQALIAIENVRLFNELQGRNRDLAEALEQQTATAEILQVISSSPTDVQPVFDAIVKSGVQLFQGVAVSLRLVKADRIERAAFATGPGCEVSDDLMKPSFAFDDRSFTGRALLRREVIHAPDILAEEWVGEEARNVAERMGWRAVAAAPMLRASKALGAISVMRAKPAPFSDKELALLRTFADQAVIAIENVRLFHEIKEALDQQKASAEVLQVISSSVADTKPVFDKILESCERLFECHSTGITLVGEEGAVHLGAYRGPAPEEYERVFPVPLSEDTATGAAILGRCVLHYPDTQAPDVPEYARRGSRIAGRRSLIVAPMLWEGRGIGAIFVGRATVGGFSEKEIGLLKTFADQAVVAIQNARLFNETREALERQTATAEILKVISGSPTDVQPVFDTIVSSAVRLCDGLFSALFQFDGELIHQVAQHNFTPEALEEVRRVYPARPSRKHGAARAILDRAIVHIPDVEADPEYQILGLARAVGLRSGLFVPMMRDGAPVGVVMVARATPGLFSDREVELLKTFADQAVIAIENVRLFNETKEALERQTASAEILRVISSTPADTQPVFDAIVATTQRLISGKSTILLLRQESQFVVAGFSGPGMQDLPGHVRTAPLDRDKNFPSRAILDGEVLHITDWESDDVPEHEKSVAKAFGIKSGLMVPLLRKGEGIGAIAVTREMAGPYHEKEISLLQSFADQAVIAIENVRLFNETKEALEQQTATAEVLQVISRSTFDLAPVFDALVENATRLCGAQTGMIFRRDGNMMSLDAAYGAGDRFVEYVRQHGVAIDRRTVTGRTALEGRTVHVLDVMNDPEYRYGGQPIESYRTILGVPLVRDGQPIGVFALWRHHVEAFTARQIALVETFADQAVIAIENVRLFNETKEALEQQTATAEILRVISGSPTDTQPVFDAIVRSGLKLFPESGVLMTIPEGAQVRAVAVANRDPAVAASTWNRFPIPLSRDRLHGAAILDGTPIDIPDAEAETEGRYAPGIRNLLASGNRAITIAPMMRGDAAIGAIGVSRVKPGPLSEKQVALLRTFAAQAVIAIENVRIFKELEARTGALTRSVEQLTALGEVGQAISSTLDLETVLKTIVSRALQLTGLDGGVIYEYDEGSEQFQLRASESFDEDSVAGLRGAGIRKGEGAVGACVVTREPTQVPDTHAPDYPARLRELLDRSGFRAILAVPLLREDHIIGALMVIRKAAGPFAPEVVELLKTFATQSALAIQNARLFREIAEKGKLLEEASQHKSQFLASMSHELRTPLNAILGFNEMILGQVYGVVPADMQEPLADIQSSGKHLLRLINNVLDLAKIEAGRMELSLADYSVHDTVESVRSTLRPLAADKGLEFLTAVPADIPLAYGDSGRITQCLMNLAGNSLKFTKAGKVEITVEQKDGLLTYRVSDTGMGIAPDKIGKLFTEFKQTDATIASEYGGTGLGLSISKKFVEMHGGRIWVESEVGRGSAFLFEIPLRVAGRTAERAAQ